LRIKTFLNSTEFRIILTTRNISQNVAARRLGVTPQYLSQLLAGQRHPSPKTRERILKTFRGFSWDKLFTIEEIKQNVD